jgi:hypothetical protein
MPYKSEAQRKYFNANRKKLEAEGVDVDEWNESSKGKKLPEKAEKKAFTNYSVIQNMAWIAAQQEKSAEATDGSLKSKLQSFVRQGMSAANKAVPAVRHHLPRIRLPDTVAGATLGGLGGLGYAGLRDFMSDNEEEDNARYKTYGLLGALGGAGAANVVGDRTRRYIANNTPAFSYGKDYQDAASKALKKKLGVTSFSPMGFLKPRSFEHIYETAIKDKPSKEVWEYLNTNIDEGGMGLTPGVVAGRHELLRRHMGLPVDPKQEIFHSTGRRWFQPENYYDNEGNPTGIASGGIAGVREHLEFNKDFYDRMKQFAESGPVELNKRYQELINEGYTPAEIKDKFMVDKFKRVYKPSSRGPGFARAVADGMPIRDAVLAYSGANKYGVPGLTMSLGDVKRRMNMSPRVTDPETGKDIPNPAFKEKRLDKPFSGLFANHGVALDRDKGTARIYDHWDFGLKPAETELLKDYLKPGTDLDTIIPDKVINDWDTASVVDSFGTSGDDSRTKRDHRNALLKRMFLNNILGAGGPVVDLNFRIPDGPSNAENIRAINPIYFSPRQLDPGERYIQNQLSNPTVEPARG